MEKLVEVNNIHHKNLRLDPNKQEQHGANLRLIPVVVPEFTHVAVQSPIVLTKKGDTGEFVFITMTGFDESENLFWSNGQWQGLYVPLQVKRQPFFLGQSENNDAAKSYTVCIDTTSPMLINAGEASNTNVESLYTEIGDETDYFKEAKQCLAQILHGEGENEKLLLLLKKFDLLQPLSLEVTFANQQNTRLNGLYTINQDKLSVLPNDQILALHKQQLLQPIYTMIASLGQIYALIELKNKKLSNTNE